MTFINVKGQGGAGCLCLFGAPFFLSGAFVFFKGAFSLYQEITEEIKGDEPPFFLLAIGALFMVVGGGIIWSGIQGIRMSKKAEAKRKEHPDSPWLQRDDWQSPSIGTNTSRKVKSQIFFAMIWNGLSWTFMIGAGEEILKEGLWGPHLFILLFPLVGVGFIIAVMVSWMRSKKFGKLIFEMNPFPGVLGGPVSGTIHIPTQVPSKNGYQLKLSCIHQYTTGSGKNRSTKRSVRWQDEIILDSELTPFDHSKTTLPVAFATPYDQPESTPEYGDGMKWEVNVSADIPGLDLDATFEIPVFETEQSREDFKVDRSSVSTHERRIAIEDQLKENKIKYEHTFKGLELTIPPLRSVGILLGSFLISVVWWSAVVGMAYVGAPILFTAFWGLFGLLPLYQFWDSILWRSKVSFDPSQTVISAGWFGKTLSGSSADWDFTVLRGTKIVNTTYWRIQGEINGQRIVAAKLISPRRAADALCEVLKARRL